MITVPLEQKSVCIKQITENREINIFGSKNKTNLHANGKYVRKQ